MVDSETAIRAVARGRVQGVGYRYSVLAQARVLGVLGWVRNEDDGAVRVHAEGPETAVGALVRFLHEGPPGAEVDAVETEPVKVEGHEQFAIRGVPAGRFVVEGAGDDGYRLGLEVDGAWRWWTLRREPSMVPAEKRMAFGGRAEHAGEVNEARLADASHDSGPKPWDAGPYEQGGRVAWPEAIDRGHAVFVLHGERLRGGFALQRTRGAGSSAQWLLIKRRDEFAQVASA